MNTETNKQQFENTPSGWAQRWSVEFASARKALEKFHNVGDKLLSRFLDERDANREDEKRHNLFWSNIVTQQALLYGQVPRTSVTRRFADAADDVARVAGEVLERLLNTDIERDSDSYALALDYALNDRLLPGHGLVRLRYVAKFETVPGKPAMLAPDGVTVLAPEVPPTERKTYENVDTDYVHWKDQLWSPCKVFHEARWWAFRAQMPQEELVRRFGEDLGKRIPLNSKRGGDEETDKAHPWGRADVWEIWDKETRQVFWYVEGFDVTLDVKPDPLGLEGFWPFPRPMMANLTTRKLVPRADFVLAQDLYNQVDEYATRIHELTDAVRVAGVYDKTNESVGQLLSSNGRNKLIPVDNWAMFAEKGGIRGCVDWFPVEQVVSAIASLEQRHTAAKDTLYEVTGMSDIMRGMSGQQGVTATEQGIKARFGSVRMQKLQDEFARFASDAQKLKAEIISKHFDAETIIERSNARYGLDAQLIPQAVQLIKSELHCYRVQVKPEAVSLTDFAAVKKDRTDVMTAIATFMQATAPVAQMMPNSMPFLLKMLQWLVTGFRGSSQIEGVIDQAIQSAEQAAQQPQQQPQEKPDPKLLAVQLKQQGDMAKTQADLQADLVRIQAEVSADEQRERNQMAWNVREAALKQQLTAASRAIQGPRGGGLP